jgi:hypothetical protein
VLLIVSGAAHGQSAQNDQAVGVAFGRRIENGTTNSNPLLSPDGGRQASRLQTRIETRLQTRVERFAPQQTDAAYAYRSRVDDGSRRSTMALGPTLEVGKQVETRRSSGYENPFPTPEREE